MCFIYVHMYIYACIRDYVHVYVCMYVCVCIVYVYGCIPVRVYIWVCMNNYVYIFMFVYLCVRSSATALRTCSERLGHVTEDSDLCSLCIRHDGNSKNDPWDDPEIRIGSCSEDQTSIRIQNRVISCECLLFYYFLIYRTHTHITYFISCDYLSYFTSMITYIISWDISEFSL